MTEGLIFQYS